MFYPALDGFRAIAFLVVFGWHYMLFPWGWAGVNLFFVLSGFLITGILFDTRHDPQRARKFYIRRTLRIFPLYYGVMLLLLLAWPLVHWNWNWMWLGWPLYAGNFFQFYYLPPGSSIQQLANFIAVGHWHGHTIFLFFGHFWSLCVEEQFYLVWPWFVFWIRSRRQLLWVCSIVVCACLAARIVGLHHLPGWMLNQDILAHATIFRLDDLLAGGFIALLIRGRGRNMALRVARFTAGPLILIAIAWAVMLAPRMSLWAQYPYPPNTLTWGFTAIQILSALLILNAIQNDTWVSRALAFRPLRWAGRLSYGAYVFHDIFHVYYFRLSAYLLPSHVRALTIGISLTATYLLAWLSFRFFETPFLNLKERWTTHQ